MQIPRSALLVASISGNTAWKIAKSEVNCSVEIALLIAEIMLQAVEEMGFKTMMEIQAKSIPPLLQGRDVLGAAKTGDSLLHCLGLKPEGIV